MSTPQDPREDALLAGAWALDALDDDERAGYEERLRSHPEERAEADGLRETASRLGAAIPPPPRLRANLLAALAATPQEPAPLRHASPPDTTPRDTDDTRGAPVTDLDVARRRSRRGGSGREGSGRRGPSRFNALVAAAAVVVAGAGVGIGLDARDDARQVRQQAAAQLAQQREVTDLLTAPGSSVVTVAGAAGGSATVVRRGTQAAVLTAGLPAAGPGRTYQLWLVTGTTATSAGLLDTTGSGESTTFVPDTGDAAGVGISVEPAGGSRQPTSTPVVIAPFSA